MVVFEMNEPYYPVSILVCVVMFLMRGELLMNLLFFRCLYWDVGYFLGLAESCSFWPHLVCVGWTCLVGNSLDSAGPLLSGPKCGR